MDLKELRTLVRDEGSFQKRLDFYLNCWLSGKYEWKGTIIGFPYLEFESRDELQFRMKELAELLNFKEAVVKNDKTDEIITIKFFNDKSKEEQLKELKEETKNAKGFNKPIETNNNTTTDIK